ncbi:MAG: DNA methyltransferase [Deltaproteobacteria bacterium]|nr:MAG: DNA methyltransferase [Deltaproteobacteria bacterium]
MPLTVLELFSGIGGLAFALGDRAHVLLAVDQDEAARATYARHHPSTPLGRLNLHHAKPAWFEEIQADLWWMSPPCQPYTIRGHQRDLEDRRSQAFLRVCEAIRVIQPPAIALENVPWFEGSQGEALLLEILNRAGYAVEREIFCPTSLGIPAARRRYYLVANLDGLVDPEPAARTSPVKLQDWLLTHPSATLEVPLDIQERYRHALHIVDAADPDAVAACFTGAYAHSPVYAGSYLRQHGRLRYFHPVEIAASLGHPTFDPPPEVRGRKQYKLVGNSLSVYAVRRVLSRLPSLSPVTSS